MRSRGEAKLEIITWGERILESATGRGFVARATAEPCEMKDERQNGPLYY